MECTINGKIYRYVKDAIHGGSTEDRERYFQLAKKVFNLDFHPWYDSGCCGDSFMAYTLYDGDVAVSSAGVVVGEFEWKGELKRYSQLSTVMTDPGYRKHELNRWLIDKVLCDWRDESDMVYLYANDSVVNYYPKFGFEKVTEYAYSLPIARKEGAVVRKLDLSKHADRTLLAKKYETNNPFSALPMCNDFSLLMFHCITFLSDKIYYVKDYDAVVIAEHDEQQLFCYDIYAHGKCKLRDVLSAVAGAETALAVLGFTPNKPNDCRCEVFLEDDHTAFVLQSRQNLFAEDKVRLPALSRA